MKKYSLFMLLASLQLSVMAQSKNEKEPFMTKSLSNESIKDVEVRTSGGNVTVTGVNASEARIEVYITGNNNKTELSKEDIQQRLNEKYDLNISVTNNKLFAITKLKEKISDWKKH